MFYYTNKRRRNKKLLLIAALAALAVVLIILIILSADTIAGWFSSKSKAPEATGTTPTAVATPEPTPQKPLEEAGLTVLDRFGVPDGFKRISVERDSFGEFLRNYPLKPYGTVPKFKNGNDCDNAPTMGVLEQTIISDNQTSPRAAMFLYASYLFEKGAYDAISFDFFTTPVFHFDYTTWLTGQRVNTAVNPPEWYTPEEATPAEPTRENFERYMKFAMAYANTHSLKAQLNTASYANLKVGDVMLEYNHAILVLDICQNEQTGEVRFICAENKTIVENVGGKDKLIVSEMYLLQDAETQSVWLTLEEDGTFVYDDKVYGANCVRRFE